MNGDNAQPLHERVSRALDAAGDLTGTALIEHIERVHGDDNALVAEVRSLLGGQGAVPVLDDAGPVQELARKLQDRLLTSELFTHGGTPATRAQSAEPMQTPTRVGGYEVVRAVGHGGMGVVYEAMQASPRRSVAIKMLSSAAPTRASLARFRREAEVLGRLKHPGIAQVFEAATDPGTQAAFFAMEFVDGPPLTSFAEVHRLSVSQRVELVARVCDAIQHAHQAGVIHRDIKPSNILVEASADGVGQPKVLDFGVASLTRESEQSATLLLDAGRIIGTLGYMPPEALDASSGASDTRGDVYSLGVLLYEALTGSLPVDVRGASLTEAARRIRETSPGPMRVSLASADAGLRADLELVTRKALEKEPGMRYASAGELAADLRRCVRHEPVLARAPSAWYTVRKFVRRRRAVSAMTLVATLLVLSAGVVAGVQYARANRSLAAEAQQRALAERKRDEAERGQYRAAIAAAVAAERGGSAVEARRALEQAPDGLRGWEWRYLHRKVTPGRVVDLGQPVRLVRPFGGGRRALAETREATPRTFLWNVATGAVERTVALRSVSVSEDGGLLVGLNEAGVFVCLRADETVAWTREPASNSRWLNCDVVRLRDDEPEMVALVGEYEVVMLEAQTGREVWRARSEYVNERGRVVAVVDDEHPFIVGMWQNRPNRERVALDARTGEWLAEGTLLRRRTPVVNIVSTSWNLHWRLGEEVSGRVTQPDAPWRTGVSSESGMLVAVGDSRGMLHTYVRDPQDEHVFHDLSVIPAGDGDIEEVHLVNDERDALVVDHTGRVRILPVAMPSEPWRSVIDKSAVAGDVSPDRTRVLSSAWGSVAVYDALTGVPVWRALLGRTFPSTVAWSHGGEHVVWFGARDGRLSEFFVLDGRTGSQLVAYSTSPVQIDPRNGLSPAPWSSRVRAVCFVPGSSQMVMAHEDGWLQVMETDTWSVIASPRVRLAGERVTVRAMAASADGRRIAVALTKREGNDETAMPVLVLDAQTLETVATLEVASPVWSVAWMPDSERLLAGHERGGVSMWDVATMQQRWAADLRTTGTVHSLAYSGVSRRIAAGTYRSSIFLLDESGETVATIASPVGEVAVKGFDDDDTLLASGFGTTLMRFAVTPRDTERWTPAALASWPEHVSRPESLQEARFMVQQTSDMLAALQSRYMSFADRIEQVRADGFASPAVRALSEAWLMRLGINVNWHNSDALVLLRDNADDPRAIATATRVLEEAAAVKPTGANIRLNLASAYRRLGDIDTARRNLRQAEAIYRGQPDNFGVDERISLATLYIDLELGEEAARIVRELTAAPEGSSAGLPALSATQAAEVAKLRERVGDAAR